MALENHVFRMCVPYSALIRSAQANWAENLAFSQSLS